MDKSLMNRIEFREQTVVLHLLKYLGQNDYVIEEFERVVFEVGVNENEILKSEGIKFFTKEKMNFVERTDYLSLIHI